MDHILDAYDYFVEGKDDSRCKCITNLMYSGVDEPLSELIAYRRGEEGGNFGTSGSNHV